MAPQKLGTPLTANSKFVASLLIFYLVFVTGNANKLKEVKAILSQGGHPIEIENQALDRAFPGSGPRIGLCSLRLYSS